MSNDSPLFEVVIPDDPDDGSGNNLHDERVDDFIEEQEDEADIEIEFGPTDPTPVPNVSQQAWGYGQSTPLFDRSRRRSFIDPLRQSTSPSLFGILQTCALVFSRSSVRSQWYLRYHHLHNRNRPVTTNRLFRRSDQQLELLRQPLRVHLRHRSPRERSPNEPSRLRSS
jgi:hypothetical protein